MSLLRFGGKDTQGNAKGIRTTSEGFLDVRTNQAFQILSKTTIPAGGEVVTEIMHCSESWVRASLLKLSTSSTLEVDVEYVDDDGTVVKTKSTIHNHKGGQIDTFVFEIEYPRFRLKLRNTHTSNFQVAVNAVPLNRLMKYPYSDFFDAKPYFVYQDNITWDESGKRLVSNSSGGSSAILKHQIPLAKKPYEATFWLNGTLASGQGAYPIWEAVDADNYYWFGTSNTIRKRSGGSETEVATGNFSVFGIDGDFIVKVIFDNGYYSVYVDDRLFATFEDEHPEWSGTIGIRGFGTGTNPTYLNGFKIIEKPPQSVYNFSEKNLSEEVVEDNFTTEPDTVAYSGSVTYDGTNNKLTTTGSAQVGFIEPGRHSRHQLVKFTVTVEAAAGYIGPSIFLSEDDMSYYVHTDHKQLYRVTPTHPDHLKELSSIEVNSVTVEGQMTYRFEYIMGHLKVYANDVLWFEGHDYLLDDGYGGIRTYEDGHDILSYKSEVREGIVQHLGAYKKLSVFLTADETTDVYIAMSADGRKWHELPESPVSIPDGRSQIIEIGYSANFIAVVPVSSNRFSCQIKEVF